MSARNRRAFLVGAALVLAALTIASGAVGATNPLPGSTEAYRGAVGPVVSGPGVGSSGSGWQNVTAGEYGGMPARWGEAAAVDGPDNLDLFFGGAGSTGTASNDTWITDDATIRNVTDLVGPTTPPPLVGASLAYDEVDHEFVLFGGTSASGRASNATWTFSTADNRWTVVSSSSSPPAQGFAPMAYDVRDGYVLLVSSTGPRPDWTFRGGSWNDTSLVGPSYRWGATMLEDPLVASLILFGGWSGGAARNATWAYAAGAWSQLSLPHSPPPSCNGSMAYDPASGLLLAFGGSSSASTWGFNGTDWSLVALAGAATPPPRVHAQMLFDSEGPFVELFGGTPPSGGAALADFWAWNPPGPPVDPTITSASLPGWIDELAVAAIAAPIAVAWLLLRPRKPKPSEAPAAAGIPVSG